MSPRTARKLADVDLTLYRLMLRIRRAEERIVALYPSDKIQSPVHLSVGQEAVAAGVSLALADGDRVHGTYRGHGVYIAKGGDLGRLFAELYGKDTGCARGRGGSMHLTAPEVGLVGCSAIVASLIPVATGDALAEKMRGGGRVVCSLFGDGAIDEGVFYESVNFAVLKSLPIVYVLENNGYAIHSRVPDRHKQTELFRLTEGLGLRGRRYDGNDARVVYKTMSAAVAAARRGKGPVLLEYMTNRWHEHVGPGTDFQEAYRYPKDRERALRSDPLKILAAALARRGESRARLDAVAAEIAGEVDAAVAFAESSPFPRAESLREGLYVESG
ncbi:MAG: thiamine pyrophosphate-dependent dehydrogenase E1 component subunit alpha [Elusimicrobia bacterium]|nr:thiamine pyrophosphate-dependent dehydrogenase E1 component subunit alpha [Elusimicrobiota bacterium]